jgi:hypothetical protein
LAETNPEKPAQSEAAAPLPAIAKAPRPSLTAARHVAIECDTYQACMLNMRLPKGFKIEQEDLVHKAISQRQV